MKVLRYRDDEGAPVYVIVDRNAPGALSKPPMLVYPTAAEFAALWDSDDAEDAPGVDDPA